MTKEDAIKVLKWFLNGIGNTADERQAIEIAIEALSEDTKCYSTMSEEYEEAIEALSEPKCETCRHNDKESAECDICCGSNSHYEPSGDLISRAEVHKVLSLLATEGGKDAKLLFSDAHESIDNIPSADRSITSGYIADDKEVPPYTTTSAVSAEPSGDLINRAELLGYIDRVTNSGLGKNKSLDYIHKYVERTESVSADRPKGEWVRIWASVYETCPFTRCSNCNEQYPLIAENYNYCPNCGARMENTK